MQQIVIIGAGPAGLTAGLELLRRAPQQYAVTILEATSALGGISRTVVHNGNRMDIGGHRFFSKDARVNAFWESLLPTQGAPALDDRLLNRQKACLPGGPDPEKTDNVMLLRDRVSRIYYLGKFFDYPISLKPQTFRNLGLARTVRAGLGYFAACVKKRPETSLENFYINRFGRPLYEMFFEDYTEKLWGRHPSVISADWGAQRVKGLSVAAVLKNALGLERKTRETSLIEQFKYPKYGPGQLWERAAAEFRERGGHLVLQSRVTALQAENGQLSAVCAKERDGLKTYPADFVLSSMPLCELVTALQGIAVPDSVQTAAAGLPYRDFVTVGLLVRRLRPKNETTMRALGTLIPDCWIYVQDRGVKLGRVQIFNNWSPYMVNAPQDTVFVGLEYFCREGDDFWNTDAETLAARGRDDLVKIGLLDENEPILDSHCEKVPKAYPAYFDTYSELPRVRSFLDGLGNLYCIGRNGQHRYNNMDHSMLTAFAAVDGIISGVPDKTAVWSVNTEKAYHETKAGGDA